MITRSALSLLILVLIYQLSCAGVKPIQIDVPKMPHDFVNIEEVNPSIILDIRYYTPHNFVGERIDGYNAPKCFLTKHAAFALNNVQKELRKYSLSLKLYDCYRPQRSVNQFIRWAEDSDDTKMKSEFYPDIDKKNLFNQDYIAKKSGHSRGSTVDVTIMPIPAPPEEKYIPGQELNPCYRPKERRFKDSGIDMGTGFDCFSEFSHTDNKQLNVQQRINRLALKSIMEKYGFINLESEWWHYTLKDEPYLNTYFDFVIE
ncbi:MAG: M15 family metallopeptidase [Thermodesulfobacteriota bacterium]